VFTFRGRRAVSRRRAMATLAAAPGARGLAPRSSAKRRRRAPVVRARATTTTTTATDDDDDDRGAESDGPVVAVYWDLDNLRPPSDPASAATMARRLRDAASALGGGALRGDPARASASRVRVFEAFGNDVTLDACRRDATTDALASVGVSVIRARGDGPDAADMAMAAHVLAFARATAARGEGEGEGEGEDGVDAPSEDELRRVVITPRAEEEERYLSDDDAEADARVADLSRRLRDVYDAAAATYDGMRLDRERGVDRVVMLATSDNDLVPVAAAAKALGATVVFCGNFAPVGLNRKSAKRASSRTKRVRRRRADDAREGGVGVTRAYWDALQAATSARPVSRLKLMREVADAAFVWDNTRPFYCDEGGGGGGATQVRGGVVGVWRKRGRGNGVGRWPSLEPVVPAE